MIDGFPRNQSQIDAWNQVIGTDACQCFMLFFECPLPVLEERILKRAKYTQRSDDNVESVRKRFNTYKDETLPVCNAFEAKKQLIEIDSSAPRDAVYQTVKSALSKFTDAELNSAPLTDRSQIILGLKARPPAPEA